MNSRSSYGITALVGFRHKSCARTWLSSEQAVTTTVLRAAGWEAHRNHCFSRRNHIQLSMNASRHEDVAVERIAQNDYTCKFAFISPLKWRAFSLDFLNPQKNTPLLDAGGISLALAWADFHPLSSKQGGLSIV
jgi:hypothetical protein